MRCFVYMGRSHYLVLDEGFLRSWKDAQKALETFSICLYEARLETLDTIVTAERYHAPLR